MGLLQAGFTIETSWPVNTESRAIPHQANMNSAALDDHACVSEANQPRRRPCILHLSSSTTFVRCHRDAATRFQHDGIDGVDLLLSTYGPTLPVISQNWPALLSTDGMAVTSARPGRRPGLGAIVDLRRSRLVGKVAKVEYLNDFVLLAWDTFG